MEMIAFDGSTDRLTVASQRAGRTHALDELAGAGSSQRILPLIRHTMDAVGLAGGATTTLVLGAGPGSFTGLRIACGVAQGLALAWGARVVPVSSFESVAEAARQRHGAAADRVWVALDARMGEVYLQSMRWQAGDDSWSAQGMARVLSPEAATALIAQGESGAMGVGSGFALYPALGIDNADRLAGVDGVLMVEATCLLALGERALRAGRAVDPMEATPLYVRDKVALTIAERRARAAARESSPVPVS
jgi:tRNA threonylcarbamoyladenosine biosynthesis protein TsaB